MLVADQHHVSLTNIMHRLTNITSAKNFAPIAVNTFDR
jgi:hypothetical protein